MTPNFDINKLVWKSEYNIGDLKIDNEHQQLFILAKKALSINNKDDLGKKKIALKEVVNELFEYVNTHFINEQTFMQRIKYPDYEQHKKLHNNMLKMLKNLIKELSKLSMQDIEKKLCDFIEEYFLRHIILEDKKINLWQTSLEELRKNFGWKHVYSVNNSKIDQEHKQLFDIAKKAFEVVDDKNRNKKIKIILTDLYTYMKTHFSHEEEYMEKIQYPYMDTHKKIHAKIIKNLNEFVKKAPSINVQIFEKELAKMIDISLLQHIIQEDRKIITWQQSKKC